MAVFATWLFSKTWVQTQNPCGVRLRSNQEVAGYPYNSHATTACPAPQVSIVALTVQQWGTLLMPFLPQ